MFDMLFTLLRHFFQICLFRLAPQQLPASHALLGVAVLLYTGLSFLTGLAQQPPSVSLLSALTDSLLLALLPASLLYLLKYPARLLQTLTALFGSGAVLALIGIPLVWWFDWARANGEDIGGPGIFLLCLFAWSLSVTAHILRHALSTHFSVGLGVAFMFSLISLEVLNQLFPLPGG